jgi:hypothetical protein
VAIPPATALESVRQRRRLLPGEGETVPLEPAPEAIPPERLAELQSSLAAARAASQRNRESLDILQAETAALRERTVELRARRQRYVAELRAAADRRRET